KRSRAVTTDETGSCACRTLKLSLIRRGLAHCRRPPATVKPPDRAAGVAGQSGSPRAHSRRKPSSEVISRNRRVSYSRPNFNPRKDFLQVAGTRLGEIVTNFEKRANPCVEVCVREVEERRGSSRRRLFSEMKTGKSAGVSCQPDRDWLKLPVRAGC